MLTDLDLPLFSGAPSAPRQPAPRPEPSQVIANQRRRARADRIRAGNDRPWIEPGTNAEGETILVGFVPVVTYADRWRALVVEHPEAIQVVIRAALEERPSFTPDGATDSADYPWFHWPRGGHDRREGRVAVLAPPCAGQRDLFTT